jgi:hypothetical protein
MAREQASNLEKVVRPLLFGMTGSALTMAISTNYLLHNKPVYSGKEVATLLVMNLIPLYLGAIPLVQELSKEMKIILRDYFHF